MITDFQCNTVYFSALLQGRAPVTYANLISALDKLGVEHRLIPDTNDVWCRDYMPMYKGRVEMVPANDLIRHEGCLNCASWTIKL